MRYWKQIGRSIANMMLRQPGSVRNWSMAWIGSPGAGTVGGVGAALAQRAGVPLRTVSAYAVPTSRAICASA
jgi:hypothetical protein